MGSTAFSSDSFPEGLRVLVVDDDPAWSNTLQKMLIKCKYQVRICKSAQEALDVLEKKKDGFDIVISDVKVADMDGFKFLEQVGLKMDLPVIMMSVDGETSRVMKGVQHGACDYLLKPIRMKELRNIWQHVFRKRILEVRVIEPAKQSHHQNLISDDDTCSSLNANKRKDLDNKTADPSSLKKPRVVWTVDLHQKFVKAVNRIGLDKVGPKKILDLMGVPWLTRENVASHLQKYRLYLSRLQKDKEPKAAAYGGMQLSDFCPEERANPLTLQQNIVINKNYGAPGKEIHMHSHSHNASICEGNVAGILSMPMQVKPEKHLFGDNYNQPFEAGSKIQAHYHLKQHFQPDHRFQLVSHNHGTSADQPILEANMNHFYSKNRSYAIGTDRTAALLSITQQGHLKHSQPVPHYNLDEKQNLHNNNLESSLENNMIVGTGSAALRVNAYSSAADIYHLQNPQIANVESFGCNELVAADVRPELYDLQNFEDEYDSNTVECYETNQGECLYFG